MPTPTNPTPEGDTPTALTNTYIFRRGDVTGFGGHELNVFLTADGPFSWDELVPLFGARVKLVLA